MTNKIFAALALAIFAQSASAYVDRTLMLKGEFLTLEKEVAIIKTEKGSVNVPARAVKEMNYRPGQNVLVFVDAKDLIELNMEKFKAAGLFDEETKAGKKAK